MHSLYSVQQFERNMLQVDSKSMVKSIDQHTPGLIIIQFGTVWFVNLAGQNVALCDS
jgi:hypothetical protein